MMGDTETHMPSGTAQRLSPEHVATRPSTALAPKTAQACADEPGAEHEQGAQNDGVAVRVQPRSHAGEHRFRAFPEADRYRGGSGDQQCADRTGEEAHRFDAAKRRQPPRGHFPWQVCDIYHGWRGAARRRDAGAPRFRL
jgi:hypothetical protein